VALLSALAAVVVCAVTISFINRNEKPLDDAPAAGTLSNPLVAEEE